MNPFLENLEKMRREFENTNQIRHLTGDGADSFNARFNNNIKQKIKFQPIPRIRIDGTNQTQP